MPQGRHPEIERDVSGPRRFRRNLEKGFCNRRMNDYLLHPKAQNAAVNRNGTITRFLKSRLFAAATFTAVVRSLNRIAEDGDLIVGNPHDPLPDLAFCVMGRHGRALMKWDTSSAELVCGGSLNRLTCCHGTFLTASLNQIHFHWWTLWAGLIIGVLAPVAAAMIVQREWMWFIANFAYSPMVHTLQLLVHGDTTSILQNCSNMGRAPSRLRYIA